MSKELAAIVRVAAQRGTDMEELERDIKRTDGDIL